MSRAATVKRIEALLPAAGDVVHDILNQDKEVECPACQTKFMVKIPDALSLKAAFGTMDRAGLGPSSKITHQQAPPLQVRELQDVVEDLLLLPLEHRVGLARRLLPEYESGSVRSLPDTSGKTL